MHELDSKRRPAPALLLTALCLAPHAAGTEVDRTEGGRYPARWWQPVAESEKAWWEILPQSAGPGEVILSKRNELGLLSNFAATPFAFRGRRYASLEGLWQSMKYPEGPDDPRARHPGVEWPHSRAEVATMVAFEAKTAGDRAEKQMRAMGIDWVSFAGERLRYRGADQARFYEIIEAATRAKIRQNPEVREVLLATGDLVLRPDHVTEENAPVAWRYYEIYMKLRGELAATTGD
ncbi:MAG: NADAR family protein [Thermoanaerobaculia bacterium]